MATLVDLSKKILKKSFLGKTDLITRHRAHDLVVLHFETVMYCVRAISLGLARFPRKGLQKLHKLRIIVVYVVYQRQSKKVNAACGNIIVVA